LKERREEKTLATFSRGEQQALGV
jgi:hypothetical protein